MRTAMCYVVVALILLGLPQPGPAQSRSAAGQYGMFGPRDLGSSLKPGETRYLRDMRTPRSAAFGGARSRFPQTPGSAPQATMAPRSLIRELPYAPAGIPPVGSEVYLNSAGLPVALPALPPTEVPIVTPALPVEPALELPLVAEGTEVPADAAADAATPEPMLEEGAVETEMPAQLPRTQAAPPELRPGFQYERPSSVRLAAKLSRQLSASPRIERISPIQVQIQGQTAVLNGVVASQYDRRVAEQVVRLEPAISDVRNNLTIRPNR